MKNKVFIVAIAFLLFCNVRKGLPDNAVILRTPAEIIGPFEARITSLDYDATRDRLAIGLSDSSVIIWDVNEKKILKTLNANTYIINEVRFSKNASYLAVASGDGYFSIYDVEHNYSLIDTVREFFGIVTTVDFSQDDTILGIGFGQPIGILWDVKNRYAIGVFSGHKNLITKLRFSPKGRFFLTAGRDKTLFVWDMDSIIEEDTSYVAEKIQPHSDYISGMEFSMDGKYFLTCSVDSSLKLWNGDNLLLINYYRHITKLWNVAFGQVGTDGLYAASDHYGVVLIFKLGSKVPDLYLPSIKKMPVRALCFTKNYLITGGDDSLLVYWDKDSINTLLIH